MASTMDQVKVDMLPKEGVHCYPANGKQIKTRRIVTIPLCILFIALGVFFIVSDNNLPTVFLLCLCCLAFIISALVFCQTFLIQTYRVAVDYNEKRLVLRYRYSKIFIPFEQLDAREGNPDKAEELIQSSGLGGKDKVHYLILDDVLEDACYQTTNKDLASDEDFFKLQEESFKIAEAYGGKNLEGAIKMQVNEDKVEKEDNPDIDDIVKSVMNDDESAEQNEETKAEEKSDEAKE